MLQALAEVIALHPALSAIPVEEDSREAYFVGLKEINLLEVVTFQIRQQKLADQTGEVDRELDEVLEGQHNRDFKEPHGGLPFWRLVILHHPETSGKFVAAFVFHHALADGVSGLAFHSSFVSALNKITRAPSSSSLRTDPESTVHSPARPLLPSLEALHPLPLSSWYLLKALWHSWFPRVPESVWTAAPCTSPPTPRRTRFRSFALAAPTTARLRASAHTHSTTLTAAAEAAFAAALFAHLPRRYKALRAEGAVSLRRWLPADVVGKDSIGAYVSAYGTEHRRRGDSPDGGAGPAFAWDDARRVRAGIEAELRGGGRDTRVGLLRYAGGLREFFSRKVGRRREVSFEFSNVGIFTQGQGEGGGDSWSAGRCVFSQSAGVIGPAIEVSVVTGGDECLSVGLSWLEGIVDGDWMENVIRTYKATLEQIAK